MSEFLKNLKNAVEEGKFNSDAAKKISEISEVADNVDVKEVEIKVKKIKPEVVSEEEAKTMNTEYEIKMAALKKEDMINKQTAVLIEIENMVQLTIGDMFSFIVELEEKFSDELEKDSLFNELFKKIVAVKTKYNIFVDDKSE